MLWPCEIGISKDLGTPKYPSLIYVNLISHIADYYTSLQMTNYPSGNQTAKLPALSLEQAAVEFTGAERPEGPVAEIDDVEGVCGG